MSHITPVDILPDPSIPLVEETASQSSIDSFNAVLRDPDSWAGAMPASQGLYMNELEKDSCGVGFICHIKGQQSHKIVSDAKQLLCNMTHRGATGADSRDGDGAGVMTGIPHPFFKREVERDLGATLPEPGEYAVGNVFFKPNDPALLQKHQSIFAGIASGLGLRVLGWREVPTDGSILGPAASSTEPVIRQPFVVLQSHYGDGNFNQGGPFDEKHLERQLYVLRKCATRSMFVVSYLCPTF
jgi:glutamate synthase (NADPH/NADH)